MTKCTRSHTLAILALLAATAAPAMAQNVQPGLWAIENKIGGNPEMEKAMAQMQAQLAAMPPAQRKQMEAIMGKSGVSMASSGAMAVKVCMTPEMVKRQQMPTQTQGDCTSKIDSQTGNTLKISFTCSNPVSSGQGIYTFESDKAYTMKMDIKNQDGGTTRNMTMDAKGQWLSADCGSVKPLTLPAQ
ncbi:hypothetical protein LPB72_22925 [Hydrogenophaga crassostreae]|uniref:DUF3617 domain-containing protein n=1 Tax=Hydrogenophaga crassostreae TaxID=1763535 RepID=A0ABX2U072_9BURK|nr:hypothetical protein LPB72_22925 [Hydrogenophaga crassostreae]